MNHHILALVAAISLAGPAIAAPQAASQGSRKVPAAAETAPAAAEARAAKRFEAIKNDPGMLYAFLRTMPKGGDLHNHLGGSIYAESYIRWAAEDGLCVDKKTLEFGGPPCDGATGKASASVALTDASLYGRLVDFLSMRNWRLSGQNGHDWFFSRFGEFPEVSGKRTGDAVAEVKARAAREGVNYLELMTTPDTGMRGILSGHRNFWSDDFATMRDRLLALDFASGVARGRQNLDETEARARELLGCGTANPDAGCQVETRYLFQGTRVIPKEYAFARLLMGFELAKADRRVVGINFVSPEDNPVSMRDYSLHMRMFEYLHRTYPEVPISLHAGELAPGLVPPEGMRDHIRQAVDVAHAKRIGHGVDVLYEDRPEELMRQMARQGVAVEVCLTSNDVILGVSGKNHPLAAYLANGVTVVLATDDPGLSRSDMTREYLRAAQDHGLNYRQLKRLAGDSLAYSFLDDFAKARLRRDLTAAFGRFEGQF